MSRLRWLLLGLIGVAVFAVATQMLARRRMQMLDPVETGPAAGLADVDVTLADGLARGAGTGIVLRKSGELLTNNHVVRGATSLRITDLGNGRTYRGRVVGYDVRDDVAVIQLQGASGLQTANVSRKQPARVGQSVTAVGNAGGIGTPTAASGKVTALRRSILVVDDQGVALQRLRGMIETSADLVPGDSGGALFDGSGRVVGMITAGSPGTGAGGGYAIPIARALYLAKAIEAGTTSTRVHVGPTAFLGISVAPFPVGGAGVLVEGVFPGSPAARTGLKAGDVITSLGRHAINAPAQLTAVLLHRHPRTNLAVAWSDGTGGHHHATVQLGSGPAQ